MINNIYDVYIYIYIYIYIIIVFDKYLLCIIKFRVGGAVGVCGASPLCFVCETSNLLIYVQRDSRNELARLVMKPIFLV